MIAAKFGIVALVAAAPLRAQGHVHPPVPKPPAESAHVAAMADRAMTSHAGENMQKHMALTPARTATREDSARALDLADKVRRAIAKYRDTTAAVADGYRMFLPGVKEQRVYHFTNNRRALKEAFRFDPSEPTSLLYERNADGTLRLTGAMFTMPKRASLARLDARVPLGIARWHRHVNWCLPKKGENARFAEKMKDGKPRFGPESPIATEQACRAADGAFHESLFGWMTHVNVLKGADLATVFGDDHGGAPHSHP